MATRKDFECLAELIGVDLSKESLRFTRSLERGDALSGDHVVSGEIAGDYIPTSVHLVASNRELVVENETSLPRLSVGDARCETWRFYSSFRPNGITCHFVEWGSENSFRRCCWLLDI